VRYKGNGTAEMNSSTSPDPDGDVLLRCKDQDTGSTKLFRVSSKVLRLASPVFANMFGPHFQEGHELRQDGCLVVELEEDDAPLMKIILDVLHYQADSGDHVMDAEKLAQLAIHCDKYDLTKALGPWVSTWFQNIVDTPGRTVGLGYRLLAASLFNDSEKFSDISKEVVETVDTDFSVLWMQNGIKTLSPWSVPGELANRSFDCHRD
jgi:hypothetical protein